MDKQQLLILLIIFILKYSIITNSCTSTSSASSPTSVTTTSTTSTTTTTTTTASCTNCPPTIPATADPGSTPGAVGTITETLGTAAATGCETLTITCPNARDPVNGQTTFQLFFMNVNCGTFPNPFGAGSATITLTCNTAGQWTFSGPNGANACSQFGTVVNGNLVLPIDAVTCLAA